jgi:two-component system chemotaxis sensor kinase CheA
MDLSSYHSQFRDEAVENLRVFSAGLLALETEDLAPEERRAQIDAVFRAMHTIKGSARLLGFEEVGRVAHTCEHILSAVREGRRPLDRALADDLLRGGDAILELVAAAVEGRPATVDVATLTLALGRGAAADPPADAAPGPARSPGAPAPAPPSAAGRPARQTVRVRVDRLDRLLNLAGELAVGQQVQAEHVAILERAQALVVQQQRAMDALERELRRLRFSPAQQAMVDSRLDDLRAAGDQAVRLLRAAAERFAQHVGQSRLLVDDLEQEVMAVRLLPAATLFANLPRAVRELARESGKEVALTLAGEETELDRKVIEALGDPLIHLLRNAVDHGIEPPEERERLGKPRQGSIQVAAQAFGAHAQITVCDDGRGIDPAHIRQSAVRKRLVTADAAERMADQEALELIFLPGFSTAPMITDISGRGVGMDVVRTNIAEIGGQVQIDSRPGHGTTFTLALPLTLVTTRVVLAEVGQHIFALPATGCQGSAWVRPEDIRTVEGRALTAFGGRLAPLLRLADLLDVAGALPFPSYRRAPMLVIGTPPRPLALVVDRLVDEREVVVKPLGPLYERQRRYSGATLLGDGRIALMLNPAALAQAANGMALAAPVEQAGGAAARRRLLVADDSFTTRELIRSILQSAGYDVTTAVDGADALDKLHAGSYDLVVSDVEMPRVDGFQLTARIRAELGEHAPPVIIVTSLASEAHRRRGLDVGAQAYIVKSQFNQGNLLETVQQLVGV